MSRLTQLINTLQYDAMIISDAKTLFAFIGHEFEVGERMLALVITKEQPPVLLLHEMFHNPSSIQTLHFKDSDNVTDLLSKALPKTGVIAVDGNLPARFLLPLYNEKRQFVNASPTLDALRAIKTKAEQENLIQASKLNDSIMATVVSLFKEGITEIELAQAIVSMQSAPPLSGTSFTPIVVFSENIADPHGAPSTRTLQKGDAVLVDMGGIYNHACSDMTRVFFFGDNPELEALYEIVLKANRAAIAMVKPGNTLASVDKAARDVITEAGYGDAFIHRTGHGIGSECHEPLDVSATNDTLIKEGMCFSIEPGIYLKGIGGIRIEDIVLVTQDGVQVLNHYPKDLKDIKLKG